MDDQRLGAAIRRTRIQRRWRQLDLAARCAVSPSTISRIERGHLSGLSIGLVRTVAATLDIRIDLRPFTRVGDLDRLLNARHSALHELVARDFERRSSWRYVPEVSFSVGGERGVIDILAIHPARRVVLVVELKTEIVDVNELVGTFDRKIRLAGRIAAERGWIEGPGWKTAAWICVADGRTSRRRVQAHASMLRARFPADGRAVNGWLSDPRRELRCLSFWPESPRIATGRSPTGIRRVQCPRPTAARPTAPPTVAT